MDEQAHDEIRSEDGGPAGSPATSRWRTVLRRVAIGVPVVLLLLTAASYVATAVMNVPPPHTLVRINFSSPSEWGELFPYRTVEAGEPRELRSRAEELPAEVPWRDSTIPLEEFLERTHTNSFVVLHGGRLVHEWYADGFDDSTRQSSFSMAKSLVSLLVGQAVGRGELAEDDRLVDLLPQLRTGGEYDEITVGHLLDMASGIDVSEVYNEYWPFTGTSLMFLTRDLPAFVEDHRDLLFTPGSKADYRSVDTQVLGLVLAEVTGKHLSDLLSEGIWKPVGAEHDARWSLDDDGGHEKAFAAVNATARDFARVGQLVLDQGRVGAEQVVPKAWIERISSPAYRIDEWGYSAQWWHPGEGTDLSALGIYGQYTYVHPDSDVVIVKLSDHGTEQDEQETFDALRAIAEHLGE